MYIEYKFSIFVQYLRWIPCNKCSANRIQPVHAFNELHSCTRSRNILVEHSICSIAQFWLFCSNESFNMPSWCGRSWKTLGWCNSTKHCTDSTLLFFLRSTLLHTIRHVTSSNMFNRAVIGGQLCLVFYDITWHMRVGVRCLSLQNFF